MGNEPILQNIINENTKLRQQLIRDIQSLTKRKLIVYTANPAHPFAIIMRQDTLLFEDILRSVGDNNEGSLMITSPGGEPNAAEKMLIMCRERFKNFEVIVPEYAKSAATMIALGSDKIQMGYLAELGPIDPQLEINSPQGKAIIPARAIIDGVESIRKKIKEGDPPQMYLTMLQNLSPQIIQICETSIEDARGFAEKWLKKYMLKEKPDQATKVAKDLSEGKVYKSHGKVINIEEAKSVLQLNIEKIENNNPLWEKIWELHCRSVQFLQQTNGAKLFESETVSLKMEIGMIVK